MDRRHFLISASGAALTSACVGGPPPIGDPTAEFPPTGRFVDANGLRVHAWDQGEGQPVVMIHGAGGNLRDWTYHLAPRIARSHRAIAFDRPGFGYTDRPAERGGDPAVQARVLLNATRALGAKRPILVGHSWGASVAMAWALADPGGVAGVVSVSGAAMPWNTQPILAEVIGLDQVLIGFYFDYLQAGAADGTIDRLIARIFRPQDPPAGYIEHIGIPLSLRPHTVAANKEDIRTLNTALRRQWVDYRSITMPVEVVSGTADPIIRPDRQPRPLAETLPNANLTLLENVGHMAHHSAPEEILAAIDRIQARV